MTEAEKREQFQNGVLLFAAAKSDDQIFEGIKTAMAPILDDMEDIFNRYGGAGAPFCAAGMAMSAQTISDSDPATSNFVRVLISRCNMTLTITRTPAPGKEG